MLWLGPAERISTGVTGPFSCCRCVYWLTWVWFIVLLKPWVGQRPGGTEGTSTGTSPSLMTVKRRRDLSKHLSSLASLLYLYFKLCITAPAKTGKDPVTGQPMICPWFERPLQVEPVRVRPICCVLLRTKSMGNRRIIPQQSYSSDESFKRLQTMKCGYVA